MQLLIIRHAEPDYETDSLTERGAREAELLGKFLQNEKIDDIYVSPLGRAKETARYTLEKIGKEATALEWLREFNAAARVWEDPELKRALPPYGKIDTWGFRSCWDILPDFWTKDERYYHPQDWRKTLVAEHSNIEEVYDKVAAGVDALLANYGYFREGNCYRVEGGTHKKIALFCHFGVEGVILSHLWNISPFALWHASVSLPTGVTRLNTEERRKGTAIFRMTCFGDLSHLALGGEEGSFAGRFCECFDDDTRH